MNEKVANIAGMLIVGIILFVGGFVAGASFIGGGLTRANSERLRQLQSELDTTTEQLAEQNRRSTELVGDVRAGITEINSAITDGAQTISNRIRETAKRIKIMEDTLNRFSERNGSNSGDSSHSSGGE